MIFGLTMCYANRTWTDCNQCLVDGVSSAGVRQACADSREAKFCYDACFLRYSDQSFFAVGDLGISHYVYVNSYVSDMKSMNASRWSLLTGLVPEASSSPLRFANSKVYTDSQGNTQVGMDLGITIPPDVVTMPPAPTSSSVSPQPSECMVTGTANTTSDIYSFGIVALEIACGRRPIVVVKDAEEDATMHLVHWAWKFYSRGRILDAADPRLNGEFDSEEMERVMVTAFWCTYPDRTVRPSIQPENGSKRGDPIVDPAIPLVDEAVQGRSEPILRNEPPNQGSPCPCYPLFSRVIVNSAST
ncbi:hypothetical protein PR202_gb23808 [Eleusine coracana subsp. coracana]|uniref:Gnk2-homologous domain-containing protein n=1 Tax=Eleusine coracana subsp. coracana TaxID=191504 RepID=A0AAV5FJR3_ELECO|nr:hypothetical protein PR202_gb23808 [Eleusine coracana subsp. coracana]